jgi:hypothetical protein
MMESLWDSSGVDGFGKGGARWGEGFFGQQSKRIW